MNTLLIFAAIAVRNPFWPLGYDGVREVISSTPIVDVSAAEQNSSADDTTTAGKSAAISKSITGKHWTEARKALRIGGIVKVKNQDGSIRQSVMINGLVYGDGDLVSTNVNNRRFTWRIQGLTEGATLKLIRVRAKFINDTEASKGESK